MIHHHTLRITLAGCTGLALLLLAPPTAPAQDTTFNYRDWKVAENNWWHIASAWVQGATPDANSIVTIGNATNTPFQSLVYYNDEAAEVNLTGGTDPNTTYLTVYNSSTLTVLNDIKVNLNAILYIKDGDVTTRSLTINEGGSLLHKNGVLTIQGGTLTMPPSASSFLIDGNAGTLPTVAFDEDADGDLPGYLYVGYNYAGALEVKGGSEVTAATGRIGYKATTSDGRVTVDGPNSSLTFAYSLEVGVSNFGTMTISNGGSVENTSGTIGTVAGSEGSVYVYGTRSSWETQVLEVGRHGKGTLEIAVEADNGSVTSDGGGFIGRYAEVTGSSATVGNGGRWDVTGTLWVGGGDNSNGPGGSGSLTVEEGGTVSATGHIKLWEPGTLTLNGGTLEVGAVNVAGGSLSGSGIINGDLYNNGSVGPGASVGRIDVYGNYQQDSGILDVEIGGPDPEDCDRLSIIGGSAELGGTLRVTLADFIPEPGQTFDFLTATDGVTGFFDEVVLPELPDGRTLVVLKKANQLRFTAVPEPATYVMLLTALLALLCLRTRR